MNCTNLKKSTSGKATAASTPKEKKYGYVFYDCGLTGDTALHTISLGAPGGHTQALHTSIALLANT